MLNTFRLEIGGNTQMQRAYNLYAAIRKAGYESKRIEDTNRDAKSRGFFKVLCECGTVINAKKIEV